MKLDSIAENKEILFNHVQYMTETIKEKCDIHGLPVDYLSRKTGTIEKEKQLLNNKK